MKSKMMCVCLSFTMAVADTNGLGMNFRNSTLFRCVQSEQSLFFLHVLGIRGITLPNTSVSLSLAPNTVRTIVRGSSAESLMPTQLMPTRGLVPFWPLSGCFGSAPVYFSTQIVSPRIGAESNSSSFMRRMLSFDDLHEPTAPPISSDDESVHTEPAPQMRCSALCSSTSTSEIDEEPKSTEEQHSAAHARMFAAIRRQGENNSKNAN